MRLFDVRTEEGVRQVWALGWGQIAMGALSLAWFLLKAPLADRWQHPLGGGEAGQLLLAILFLMSGGWAVSHAGLLGRLLRLEREVEELRRALGGRG